MLIEHAWDRKFGEPLPTLEDVMREAEEVDPDKVIGKNDKDKDITVQQAMDYSGDNETMNTLKKKVQDLKANGGEDKPEEPKSKGLEPDDFERDFDDEEPSGEPEGGEEPSGEPKTFDDIKNHHSKAVSAQDKVNDMIDKHNADHQMQDDDYEKWEDKREELKAIENELQALTVDDPNDSSYDGYKKGQKELTKQYISTLNKLSPDAKKILNKEEDKKKYTKQDDEEPSGEPPEMKKRKASAQAVSALGSDGSDEQAENLYQLVKTPEDRDDPVLGKEHEVESDDGDYTYDSPGWEIVQNIAVKARNSDDPAETFKKEFENAPPEVQEYILANIGKGKAESIKVINGKKYRPIKESVEPKKHLLREMYERIGGK